MTTLLAEPDTTTITELLEDLAPACECPCHAFRAEDPPAAGWVVVLRGHPTTGCDFGPRTHLVCDECKDRMLSQTLVRCQTCGWTAPSAQWVTSVEAL